MTARSRALPIVLLAVPWAAWGQTRAGSETPVERLVSAAVAQTRTSVTYDGSYRRIAYPGGDVPETVGVCTDVVIRAYRRIGVDLPLVVHNIGRGPEVEDMLFRYPIIGRYRYRLE